MEGVLETTGGFLLAKNALAVGFIFAEQQFGQCFLTVHRAGMKFKCAELLVFHHDRRTAAHGPQIRLVQIFFPRPGVAKPQVRQDVKGCSFRPTIVDGHAHQDVFRRILGVFHEHVEVTVIVKNARVEQFKFRFTFAARRAFCNQPVVGKGALRILVEHLQVGMRRRGVEVVIKLLHVFAVIAFGIGKAEETFLQNWILAVPHGERETEPLQAVAEAGNAILAPAVGAAARVVVRKIFPCRAAGRIILADSSPLAFGKIRPKKLPRLHAFLFLGEPDFFSDDWHLLVYLTVSRPAASAEF